MDMTPLLQDAAREPAAFARERIERFAAEVDERLARLRRSSAGPR
jgi:hypothetical protein